MTDEVQEEARAFAREHGGEALELLRTLGRIPSPTRDEGRRAEFVLSWLRAHGATEAYVDGAMNVICPVTRACASGDDGSELVVFCAHTDVVFPDTNPLPLEERDGRIFCPGIGDDTANLVCLLMATAHLLAHPRPLPHGLLVVANSCEEGLGNLDGTKAVLARYGSRVRAFVSLDCSLPTLVTGAVGSHRWRVGVEAEGGHSWSDFGRPNAIVQLAGIIRDLVSLKLPSFARTTLNVGTIQGGSTVNSIPQHAEMLFEYRSTADEALAIMRRGFERVIDEHLSAGEQVTTELVGIRPSTGDVDPVAHEALIATCGDVMATITGEEPRRTSSSTDANVPLSLGIPAATVGTVVYRHSHTREEWVETASVEGGCAIALALMLSV